MFRLFFVLCVLAPLAHAAGGFGVGAFPVSRTAVSMWLLADDGTGTTRPLALVYFTGPTDWHHHGWQSKFGGNMRKDAAITYRLVSSAVTLEISASADRRKLWVQGHEYSVAENNVFIVKHANDPTHQRVEPEGHLTLPAGTTEPLPVVVLREHSGLKTRLD